ncbi:solute carrier family 2, facilitated glucose transporter member 5-like [Clavelina lepadiformis]|uniref:Major facilitator superfamily (MFS) profile domain-containing protein n=1 Tax=Clavelina lepadiformis TaxID=159417 RepID=A0ABP0EWK9_CLALP
MGEGLVEDNSKPKATFPLIMGVAMAVIGSAFQYGYNIAVVNAPADEIKDYFFGPLKQCENVTIIDLNATTAPCVVNKDHKSYRENMYSLAVAAFPFAGMIGSLLVGPVVAKFGRLGGLMINNLISVLSAICLGAAKPAGSFALIVIGRFLIGVFAGLATGVVPMYIGEISPKEWRGAIGVLNQLLITIGILVAQLFGLQSVLGTPDLWPFLLAFTCVPSILQSACFPFMPKSPRFLLIDQQKEDEARNTLVKLRGTDNVMTEMEEMRTEAAEQEAAGALSIPQLFRERTVRWQLITILLMMVAQQLSGINAVFFYSNKIFDAAGIPKGNPQDMASVAVGSVNVLMTIISVAIIERTGRKALMVWGFGQMIFWCLALTIILNLLVITKIAWISYLSIACVIGYIVGFAIGPGPIPWLITAELFRQAARPPAFMVACLVNWTCNFIVGISFPSVADFTGPYVFIGFMAVCIFITVFLAIVMPETKGKTFQEISNLFAKRNKVPGRASVTRDQSQKIPLKSMENHVEEQV